MQRMYCERSGLITTSRGSEQKKIPMNGVTYCVDMYVKNYGL